MKKALILLLFVVVLVFVTPTPTLAQTDTGPIPGSFWYGITTTFENVNLFFTFNAEKKAEKALNYAERRLTQAKTAVENENTDATEIALNDYEEKLTLATKSSKKIEDDERAEKLLTTIADNTARHQETLSEVLEKVPEEAREAIAKAMEASKRGQEEATHKIAELKGEVERLKQEVAELRSENKNTRIITDSIQKKQECDELWKKIPDKRGYDNWGNTSDIASLYNRARILLAQETLWDTDENKKLVKEVFDEVKPLYENYVKKCGQPTTPEVKVLVPQNPQCFALKEQIDIQNNKKAGVGSLLKKIKGEGGNNNTCDDKILVDQISCYNEQIQLKQKLVENYAQQIIDIESVIKDLLSDYKKYACNQ